MKVFTKCLIVVCILAVSLFVLPGASADDWSKKTVVTFSAPVEVPGVGAQVLPAGTYVFKLVDSLSDRHIVRIFNQDETQVLTTILAIPNYRLHATDKTVMTFKERAQGEPEAIRAWFYPGNQSGEEFVYSKAKALELAKIANEPVLATPVPMADVEALKTAPIEAVNPAGEPVPVTAVVQAPPVVEAPPVQIAKVETLPQTASHLPLLFCVGLLSIGAAGLITKYSV